MADVQELSAAGSFHRLESNALPHADRGELPGLVLPARTALMEDEAVLALLDRVEIPVLLVR